MPQSFHPFDVSRLRLLHEVVVTGSTQQAASRLGLSQSNVSRGLKKLQDELDCPLFARQPHGLEATPLARELAAVYARLQLSVDEIMAQQKPFEPSSYQGELRLVIDRACLPTIGPRLLVHLNRVMPEASFSLVSWDAEALDKLLGGDYHYGITHDRSSLPKRLHTELLITDPLVMVARRDHPGFRGAYSLRSLLRDYPLVRMVLPQINSLKSSALEQWLAQQGIDYFTPLKTDDHHTLVAMLQHLDGVVVACSRLIAELSSELVSYPPTPEVRELGDISYFSAYAATQRQQPLYLYLDNQVRQVLTHMQRASEQA